MSDDKNEFDNNPANNIMYGLGQLAAKVNDTIQGVKISITEWHKKKLDEKLPDVGTPEQQSIALELLNKKVTETTQLKDTGEVITAHEAANLQERINSFRDKTRDGQLSNYAKGMSRHFNKKEGGNVR